MQTALYSFGRRDLRGGADCLLLSHTSLLLHHPHLLPHIFWLALRILRMYSTERVSCTKATNGDIIQCIRGFKHYLLSGVRSYRISKGSRGLTRLLYCNLFVGRKTSCGKRNAPTTRIARR